MPAMAECTVLDEEGVYVNALATWWVIPSWENEKREASAIPVGLTQDTGLGLKEHLTFICLPGDECGLKKKGRAERHGPGR